MPIHYIYFTMPRQTDGELERALSHCRCFDDSHCEREARASDRRIAENYSDEMRHARVELVYSRHEDAGFRETRWREASCWRVREGDG